MPVPKFLINQEEKKKENQMKNVIRFFFFKRKKTQFNQTNTYIFKVESIQMSYTQRTRDFISAGSATEL